VDLFKKNILEIKTHKRKRNRAGRKKKKNLKQIHVVYKWESNKQINHRSQFFDEPKKCREGREHIIVRGKKKRKMAYERSVEPHHNILIQFLPNKRSKEHIESKPQCQKYSNSYHLHRYEIGTPKNEILNDKRRYSPTYKK